MKIKKLLALLLALAMVLTSMPLALAEDDVPGEGTEGGDVILNGSAPEGTDSGENIPDGNVPGTEGGENIPDGNVPGTEDVTLRTAGGTGDEGGYSEESCELKIKYNNDAGKIIEVTVFRPFTLASIEGFVPEDHGEKAHYEFDAWYHGEDKVTKFDEEIDVDKYTLEGKWTPEQITVTFYDGDTKVGESTGAYDTTISSVPEPSIKEHYTGCKWVDNDGHEVIKYPAENTELHAKWIPEVYTATITSEENPHVTYSEQVEYKGYISKEAVRGILEFDETKYDRPKESFQWTIGGEAKSVSQLEGLQIEEDTDIVGSWVPATIHHGRIDFQDFQIHEGLPEYPG